MANRLRVQSVPKCATARLAPPFFVFVTALILWPRQEITAKLLDRCSSGTKKKRLVARQKHVYCDFYFATFFSSCLLCCLFLRLSNRRIVARSEYLSTKMIHFIFKFCGILCFICVITFYGRQFFQSSGSTLFYLICMMTSELILINKKNTMNLEVHQVRG